MNRQIRSVACLALVSLGCSTQAHDERATALEGRETTVLRARDECDVSAQFELAPGLAATLWAESPALYNPTAIDVDARGRIWVAEAVNYRRFNRSNQGLAFPDGDRIVILEDTDGDGVCDSSKVFVQDRDLVAPLGIAVLGDRVIVSCSPNAIVYTDANHDDVPDSKEVFLTGFGGFDHDHGLHSFVGGPDGALWAAVGNAGPHLVTDRSGWNLRSGSIADAGVRPLAENKPRLRSDDGRIWTGGLVLSVEPDATHLAVRAHNFRNNYEVAVDSFGDFFQADNDDDGNASCRVLCCLEGGNHGYFSSDGSRTWAADRRPGQSTPVAHWHQDDPGVVPFGTITGAGGPTGVVVNENAALGAELDGALFQADAGRNVVWAHRVRANGAGLDLEPRVLIRAKVGEGARADATFFRPSDVAIGIDGSVFVADWYDAGVGGHGMADTRGYGRILRLAPKARALAVPKLDLATLDGALAALRSPAVDVRWCARRTIAAAGAKALAPLQELAADRDHAVGARALWLLARLPGAGVQTVEEKLIDYDESLRLAAFRALRAAGVDVVPPAHILADDASPRVRAEAALALRDRGFGESSELLEHLARRWDGVDRRYLEALGIGASGKEGELLDFLGRQRNFDAAWRTKMLWFAWRLHPLQALATLVGTARDEHASSAERKLAIDGLAFVMDRAAATAMLDLALAGPEDLRSYAAWWFEFRRRYEWREYGIGDPLATLDREHAKRVWSSGVMEHGLKEFEVELGGATNVLFVVGSGARGNSCDWSDWLDLRFVGAQGETKLSSLTWSRAKSGWGSVQIGKNCNGGPLAIDGAKFTDGIGTHAESEIVYRVPSREFTRLVGRCGPDDGGTTQASGVTDVEFEIWVDSPPDRSAFDARVKVLADASANADAKRAAARELAATSEGALYLVHAAERGRLDPTLASEVASALLSHGDPAVRALAAAQFDSAATAPRAEPTLDELAALNGDARRGEKLFFGERVKCATCHRLRGRGGDVGPELTEIRKKYASRELFDNLLHPSKAIDFNYQSWIVELNDGRVLTGFVEAGDLTAGAKGTGTVVLRDTTGARVTFGENEVESATRQTKSVMPEDAATALAPNELADLSAFLLKDFDAPPKLGAPLALFDRRSFAGWTFFLEDPKATLEQVWSIRDGVMHCLGQPIGYLRTTADFTNYVLDVDWRFVPGKPPGNSGVLLRMVGEDKVWPKSIEAHLEHRNAGDFWNIDKFSMQVDAARTEGRHTTKEFPSNEKPLGEWNHYHITVNHGDVTLEVNGLVQNRAHWVDEVPGKICLQSEGSEIEFGAIVLTPIVD